MIQKFSKDDVQMIAQKAAIPVTEKEERELAAGFTSTIAVVEKLQTVDVSRASEHHITGLSNAGRDDAVDESRMFSQEEALSNAKRTHNGYFVVDQVLEQEA